MLTLHRGLFGPLSAVLFMALANGMAAAQESAYASCDEMLPLPRVVRDAQIGPASCLMQEAELTYKNRSYMRVDLGLDGAVEGFVTREGDYHEYLTNAPELVFPQAQASAPQQPVFAVARYERARGAAILLLYPQRRRDWNGKLWVTAHGRGRSFRNGSLKTWHQYLDPEDPLADLNKLQKAMLSLGYAVAVTRRTSEESVGEILATLEDGTIVDFVAFNDSHSLIKDYTRVAENVLAERLGKAPERTFLYGKSAGARLARGMNYFGYRLNVDSDGKPIFDGFLVDDSAAGTWLPVVIEEGKDTLLDEDDEKAAFVPQLELAHQAYWNFNNHDLPEFVTYSFLANKYNNARILMEKGMTDKFRLIEIRQLSHDGGSTRPDGRNGKLQMLDLSLLMEGAINLLDAWVAGGAAPLSRSDYPPIGDVDNDGAIDNPAIAYPEVACPLGIFYPYPRSGSGATSWAAFTGNGIEPRDEHGVFVDMNGNGLWDFRETPAEAWQRLGLLDHGEELTRPRYVDCVGDAAAALADAGLFDPATVAEYVRRAQAQNLEPASDEEHALIYFSRF
ncbi:MAG: hypothetical protein OEO82_11320 [Gammaproteobacteria bacterium]|nr:hypothetical protein [Gammaproteobacteria bacterium]